MDEQKPSEQPEVLSDATLPEGVAQDPVEPDELLEDLEEEDGKALARTTSRHTTTFTPYRSSKRQLLHGAALYQERLSEEKREPTSYEESIEKGMKPKQLKTCLDIGLGEIDKPCPYLSCKGHAFGEDVRDSYKLSGPHHFTEGNPVPTIELEGQQTCSYRLFQMQHTLEEIGQLMWLTRERVRQLEERALFKVRAFADEENRDIVPQLGDGKEEIDEKAKSRWLGSIWTSSRGERLWLVIEFGGGKAKIIPLQSPGVPVSVSIDTLSRNYKLKYDGDTVESARKIVSGIPQRKGHGPSSLETVDADEDEAEVSADVS